jgi:hypothetical protein
MKLRCSPCNPRVLFVFLGIFLFYNPIFVHAQCHGDFSLQSFPAENGSSPGKIEVVTRNAEPTTYTFKIYELAGTLKLVETRQELSPEKVTFERLKPAIYFVKIEWGESCYKTLGGYEGISITQKDQGR